MSDAQGRIFLSPPDVRGPEQRYLDAAVASNWIAPTGPDLARFEEQLAITAGRSHCVATVSGTAALHLALLVAGVGPGDDVLCSTLTFVATANAAVYAGATPSFVDSAALGWSLDPELLAAELKSRAAVDDLPAAVVAVDLYGQCAPYAEIAPICERYEVALIEDAAEAIGASANGRPAGSFGRSSVFSFNGNKTITTSGGGAFLCDDADQAARVRHLATQAREPVLHYEHVEVGYNYGLSNLLAAFGRGQLESLDDRVRRRREINHAYRQVLGDLPGIEFMDELPGGHCSFWLTALTVDPDRAGYSSSDIIERLDAANIEARPVWKPMHRQPVFARNRAALNGVSDRLFERGVCLPSGSSLSDADLDRVFEALAPLTSRG